MKSTSGARVSGVASLFFVCSLVAAAAPVDLDELRAFERAQQQQTQEALQDRAKDQFAGKGQALVEAFLYHTDHAPSNSTYFFLFSVLGESEIAMRLTRAVLEPPPQPLTGRWPRDVTEVRVALEESLAHAPANEDPRVVSAIEAAIQRALGQPESRGVWLAEALVECLGRCHHPDAQTALLRYAQDSDA